jgi:hypothetical protein
MTDIPKPRRANTKPGAPAVLLDPRRARPEEHIGGGWFVFRRTKGTGRIRAPEWPFEWQTRELAEIEAARLTTLHLGETFQVFGHVPGRGEAE